MEIQFKDVAFLINNLPSLFKRQNNLQMNKDCGETIRIKIKIGLKTLTQLISARDILPST